MELEHDFTVPHADRRGLGRLQRPRADRALLPRRGAHVRRRRRLHRPVKVKLGPISLQYTGKGTFVERDEAPTARVIEAKGKDKRGNGTAGAIITAHLREDGAGTKVAVNTDLNITGKPAQFGRGVMQDVGNKLLDQFASCLSTRLGGGALGAAAGAPAAAAAAGTPEAPAGPAEVPAGAAAGPVGIVAPGPTVAESNGPAAGPSAEPAAAAREAAGPAPGAAAAAPSHPAAVPVSPATPTRRPPAEPAAAELDLGHVMGPVLLRRFGPVVAACAVTAVITWVIARRR